ncbi:hypothetical protein [Microvirga massiliensis]|uniref:hypothetical protein n=1 Tax=Microvirga massiliensis TaxID=1033741 RepID=UPI000AD5EBA5|nr:hypothetical protein [Microvirga massiliensis]
MLYDERFAKDLEDAFALDLAHCTAFEPGEYARRSANASFRDSVARSPSLLL